MTRFVADACVILSWLLDEGASTETDNLLDSLATGGIVESPVLLRYEVANGLVMAFKPKKRISQEACFSGLKDFDRLPIRYDTESPRLATTHIAELAVKHSLTIYDAAYLSLAIRNGLTLATFDEKLAKSAISEGILVVGWKGKDND